MVRSFGSDINCLDPLSFFDSSSSFVETDQCNISLDIIMPYKDIQDVKSRFYFEVGASMCPHPEKKEKGGEDAYFVSMDRRVVGVADGVGGWTGLGVDPSLYSNSLMRCAKDAVDNGKLIDPIDILTQAYEETKDISGSCTACVVSLEGDILDAVNVGDSGFMVLRNGKIIYRSKEQQYSFNYPYQLGTGSSHTPSDGDATWIDIQDGDIVIVGSDGLFDNLFDQEILTIVNDNTQSERADVQQIADFITQRAHEAAAQETIPTPFCVNARKSGYTYNGGKMDDITVVVCIIKLDPAMECKCEVDA